MMSFGKSGAVKGGCFSKSCLRFSIGLIHRDIPGNSIKLLLRRRAAVVRVPFPIPWRVIENIRVLTLRYDLRGVLPYRIACLLQKLLLRLRSYHDSARRYRRLEAFLFLSVPISAFKRHDGG